jgi:hypothetical protein
MSENREDPVVEEVREIRRRLAAEIGSDPAEVGAYFREYQKQFADRLVSPPRRQDRPNRKPAA